MSSLLSSLNTSYTGLATHQVMVDVTGNNIANANDEFYSRERVMVRPETPLNYQRYTLGRGIEVQTIQRAHDDFVFSRYEKAASAHQKLKTQFDTLKEASTYYPDVDGVGIYNDLQSYFNAWKNITKSPSDPAQKQILGQVTQTLTTSIKDTHRRLEILQAKSSDDLKLQVDEVNRRGQEIANINVKIREMEDHKELKEANTLRDRRDKLEFELIKIIGGNVFKKNVRSNMAVQDRQADFSDRYILNIGKGFNIVDGVLFHPLVLKNDNIKGLNRVYFQGDDYKTVDITDKLTEGKIGGLIKLYNNGYEGTKIGRLQKYINELDSFAKGLIDATNGIYSQSASNSIVSDKLTMMQNDALSDTNYNINSGTFELKVYNTTGETLVTKAIKITPITTMNDIVAQINSNADDNKDGNSLNDLDDYFHAYYDSNSKVFEIRPKDTNKKMYISLRDNGTNFTGALGLNRFFSGDNAGNIDLNYKYKKDPTYIRPWLTPISGNFDVANMMTQLQYDKVDFYTKTQNEQTHKKMKISEYYQFISGNIASDTQEVKTQLDTKQSVLAAIKKESLSISQVSVDEEMVNLIKFQGGYAANAKVITAIDKMIQTLLAIKQP